MDRDQEIGMYVSDRYDRFLKEQSEEAIRVQKLVDEGRASLEKGDAERARVAFIKALSIFPWVPPALTNLAALALQREEYDQAWQFLSELFEHFPTDPSGNGVAVRYWLRRGSSPLAYHHARRALAGLEALAKGEKALSDPSLVRRASIILLSTFASFEADDLICQLYEVSPSVDWDATAYLTLGVAFYNRGDLGAARTMWSHCGEAGPGRLYRMLLDLNAAEVVPPFRLDYNLGARMPTLEELQHVLQVNASGPTRFRTLALLSQTGGEQSDPAQGHIDWLQALRYAVSGGIPSVAVLDGIDHVLHGDDEQQAELALSILFIDRWPHLSELLSHVVGKTELSVRLRLGATLYMLWTDGTEAAKAALSAIELHAASDMDHLLAQIVRLQVALMGEEVEEGRRALEAARGYAERAGSEAQDWIVVLDELTLRFRRLAKELPTEEGGVGSRQVKGKGTSKPDNVILFPTVKEREGHDTAGS